MDGKRGFQPYRAPSWASKRQAKDGVGSISHDAGNWNVYYLYLHNVDFQENRDRCPKTVALLDSIASNNVKSCADAIGMSASKTMLNDENIAPMSRKIDIRWGENK